MTRTPLPLCLLLLAACQMPSTPTPGADLMPPPPADLAAPPPADLRPPGPDLAPPPADLAGPMCLHDQVAQAGMCQCAAADDITCAAGHCCAATQRCLPPLGAAMYRCSPPSARQRHVLAYDAHRGRSLIFGGMTDIDSPVMTDLAYELDKDTFSPLRGDMTKSMPGPRSGVAAAYDELNQRIVLYGGQQNSNAFLTDTYAYNGAWQPITATPNPGPRAIAAMAYDSNRKQIVLYGGTLKMPGMDEQLQGDTWEFNVMTNHWVLRSMGGGTGEPPAVEGAAMAYDKKNKRTVLFGGSYGTFMYSNQTFVWDGTQWSPLKTTGTPEPRAYFAMAYDEKRGVVVLMGGETNAGLFGALNTLWELDGLTWTNKTPAMSPMSGRLGHAMTYDAGRGMVLISGGLQNDIMDNSDELWGWDGTTLTRLY